MTIRNSKLLVEGLGHGAQCHVKLDQEAVLLMKNRFSKSNLILIILVKVVFLTWSPFVFVETTYLGFFSYKSR